MKKLAMDNKKWMLLFAVLSLAVIAFIWGNSLQSIEKSGGQSKVLSDVVKPQVDPGNKVDPYKFENFLRKCAHLLEFSALGICVAGFTVNLGRLKSKRFVSLPFLIVLCVAVIDEYIQHFAGRGSAVTDVVLDFAGAAFGLSVAVLFCWLRKRRRSRA